MRSLERSARPLLAAHPKKRSPPCRCTGQLARLVEELSAEDRQIVVLRYFEERTSEQIGRSLGIPAATVRWRLGRSIESLRRRLDAEHGGSRTHWRAALLPLCSPPSPRAAWPAKVALPIGALAVLGSLVALFAPAAGRRVKEPASMPGVTRVLRTDADRTSLVATTTPLGGQQRAPLAAGASACTRAIASARRDLADLQQDLRLFEDHQPFFEAAQPGSAAEQVLAPLLGDLLAPEQGAVLECRRWICRILFVRHPDQDWRVEQNSLLEGPWRKRLGDRVNRVGASRLDGISRDPVSGQLHQKYALYLHLQHPLGEPDRADDRDLPALPSDPAACEAELSRVRAEVDALRPRHSESLPIEEQFRRASTPDGAATADVRAAFAAALGPLAGTVKIDCRAGVCRADRLSGPGDAAPAAPTWRELDARLDLDQAWRNRFPGSWAGPDGERYYRVRPTPRPVLSTEERSREEVWENVRERVFPSVRACANRHPGAEAVRASVLLPGEGELNEDGVPRRVSIRVRGKAASGPFGRCIRDEAEKSVRSLLLPAGMFRREMMFVVGGRPPGSN